MLRSSAMTTVVRSVIKNTISKDYDDKMKIDCYVNVINFFIVKNKTHEKNICEFQKAIEKCSLIKK